LLDFYVQRGGTGHAFWADIAPDELKAVIGELATLRDEDAIEADFVDLGETAAFEVSNSEGECAS
jgi:hypothetical protein